MPPDPEPLLPGFGQGQRPPLADISPAGLALRSGPQVPFPSAPAKAPASEGLQGRGLSADFPLRLLAPNSLPSRMSGTLPFFGRKLCPLFIRYLPSIGMRTVTSVWLG